MSDRPTTPRTTLPWSRSHANADDVPSRCYPREASGWTIRVGRAMPGRYVAMVDRSRDGATQRHACGGFATVDDAEAWCERLFTFLSAEEISGER